MHSRVKVFIPLIVILFLTGVYILPVSAYVAVTFGGGNWALYDAGVSEYVPFSQAPYLKVVKHSAGKFFVVEKDETDSNHLHVIGVSAAGALLSNTDLGTGATIGARPSVYEYDADELLIICISNQNLNFIRFNVNSLSVTSTVTVAQSGHSGTIGGIFVSNAVYNPTTSRWYVCWGVKSTATSGYAVAYYTGSAGAQIAKINTYTSKIANAYATIDVTAQHIYFLVNLSGTYHVHDLAVGAGTFTDIATAPFSGGIISTGAFAAGYGNYYNFYGGGIYDVSTFKYLWFAWSHSERTGTWGGGDTGVRNATTVFYYLKCNNTISAGTILENTMLMDTEIDSSGSLSVALGLSNGYISHQSTSATFDLYTYYQDIASSKYVSRTTYHITDLGSDPVDFDSETVLQGVDNLDWDFVSIDSCSAFSPLHGWTYNGITSANCQLSVGGPVLAKDYTFTESYSPADSPLNTGTVYTFTYTVYVNGVVDNLNETYKIFINGVERASGSLPSSGGYVGKAIEQFSFSTVGTYDFIVWVYDNGGIWEDASETYSHTVVASGGGGGDIPDGPAITGGYIYIIGTGIPILLVVLGPILALGLLGSKMGGAGAMVGMIIGAVVGVIAGVNTSILPSYTIYLLAMAVIGALVVFAKMGGSGGGGG